MPIVENQSEKNMDMKWILGLMKLLYILRFRVEGLGLYPWSEWNEGKENGNYVLYH